MDSQFDLPVEPASGGGDVEPASGGGVDLTGPIDMDEEADDGDDNFVGPDHSILEAAARVAARKRRLASPIHISSSDDGNYDFIGPDGSIL